MSFEPVNASAWAWACAAGAWVGAVGTRLMEMPSVPSGPEHPVP